MDRKIQIGRQLCHVTILQDYHKSLGDLNVEKFTHKHPRRVDGVTDVWHAYPHSSRNLHDIGIARKLDWHLYKWLF